MGLIKGIVKGAVLAGVALACPPAAGVILLGNVTYKVAKGLVDENQDNAVKHFASTLLSIGGDVIDIDVDAEADTK